MKYAIRSAASRAPPSCCAVPATASRRVTRIYRHHDSRSRPGGSIDRAIARSSPPCTTGARSSVNIHEMLEDVCYLKAQTVADRASRVKKWFDPSLPPIRGDRAQLTQVFLNLVKNAFQAMDERRFGRHDTSWKPIFISASKAPIEAGLSGWISRTKAAESRRRLAPYFLAILQHKEQWYRSRPRGVLPDRQGAWRPHPRRKRRRERKHL